MYNNICPLENKISFFVISRQRRPRGKFIRSVKQLKSYIRFLAFMVFALVVLVANSSNVNSQASWSPVPGSTPSTPALAWYSYLSQTQIVVRASDDSIWTANFLSNGSFVNNWAAIPGRTPSTPALAWNLGFSTHHTLMVVRDSNDNLWKATFDYVGNFNNDWQSISGKTPSAPALIRISNGFMLVVRSSDNSIWTATFNSDGVFNNDWESIPGATPSTPALAWDYSIYGPPPECPLIRIMIVVRDSDNSLWKGWFDSYGNFISNWVPISGLTPSSPALGNHSPSPPCSYAHAPDLWVRGQDNSLWQRFVDVDIWSRIPGATPSPPAVVYAGQANFPWFWVVVRDSDDSIWLMREW